ncbi:S9 family peptidase [Cellvibrio sp. KY-YJ-3]|uniref:alpha/beta hydrolase family protein n=1 Tax=Cellvibrio sp. KY-YJ-3 TaxID=454662 RepID=UPI00177AF91A|nr:prolyl oligopeptidase family serine peptidase [Cellvibrio sp. KY-YJ-3]
MRTIVRILILTGLLSACSDQREGSALQGSALVVSSPLIMKEKDCFNWGENYAQWIKAFMGERSSPQFQQRIEQDIPPTLYEKYRTELVCKRFVYRVDGLDIEGIYTAPKQVKGKTPALIFNRGGNGSFGKIKPGIVLNKMLPLASEGYFVIASQYRGAGLNNNNGFDEFGGRDIHDVLALLDIIDATTGVDPQRIGLYGWSRCGMMAFLAAKHSDRFSAIVVGGAPTDLWAEVQTGLRPEMERNVFRKRIPNYQQDKQQTLIDRSVVYWLDELKSPAPILILHGDNDQKVRVENALSLAEKLAARTYPHKLVIYKQGDHGLTRHKQQVHQETIDWLRKYL